MCLYYVVQCVRVHGINLYWPVMPCGPQSMTHDHKQSDRLNVLTECTEATQSWLSVQNKICWLHQSYRVNSLSPGDRAALAQQSARLKKNDRLLQLHKDNMLPRVTGRMADLKTEICQIFTRLGQACKQDCIGKFSTNRIAYVGNVAKWNHM